MNRESSKLVENPKEEWVAAVYKVRPISFLVMVDSYQRFVSKFLISFSKFLNQSKEVNGFYYGLATDHTVGFTYGHLMQLNFLISPFHLQQYLKPALFRTLNHYFDKGFLVKHGIEKLDESLLSRKRSEEGIIQMEEYQIDFMVGAGFVKPCFSSFFFKLFGTSSNILLKSTETCSQNWLVNNTEKSIFFHLPVLHTFLRDRKEMFCFLSWAVNRTMDQIKKVNEVVDLYDWKFKATIEVENSFQKQKSSWIFYSDYVLETLDEQEEFEEGWLNDWKNEVKSFYSTLLERHSSGSWPPLYRNYLEDDSVFHEIDEQTYRIWQLVYYIIKNVNSQFGVNFFQEFDLLYAMKNTMKILDENSDSP